MIEALIAGKLQNKPEQRTSKSGKPFAVTKVRVPSGDDAYFVSVVAFSTEAIDALLALDAGEAVALSGALSVKVWTDRDGNARPDINLVANQLLTVHHAKRKREAMSQCSPAAAAPPPRAAGTELDDGPPDPWLDEGGH